MARDPPYTPAPSASSELRDLSLSPSSIQRTKITIVHPQLRDLILPLARGKILYPRDNTVEEYSWESPDDEDLPSKQWSSPPRSDRQAGKTSTVARLSFTPNCLTVRGNILACGGQHGQLYLSTLSSSLPSSALISSVGKHASRFDTPTSVKQFILSETLPKHAINNSLTILPSWPNDWKRRDRPGGSVCESDSEISEESEEECETDEDIEMDSPSSSVATYPNTVPFQHAPRMHPPIEPSRSSRSSRSARTSFSSVTETGVQYVSSLSQNPSGSGSNSSKRKRKTKRGDEPRLLISNNDQTVKMFSLRSVDKGWTQVRRDRPAEVITRLIPRRERARETIPPPMPRFGGSYGWETVGLNGGIQDGEDALRAELERAREHLRSTQETLRREREEFERRLGMNITPHVEEKRRLAEIGGNKFKYAINHSSLSPDLTTMVSVGDSTDVYLFQVMNGGRDFRRIGVYESSGKGFSTSWSKDGRKFAVASEDGQVTVWDHRSSRPLALFHTSPVVDPSFSTDLSSSRAISPSRSPNQPTIVLYDPVTGESSTGTSTSGREAARVVKFSPEGSSRDLMVFTEENSNLHIVDAKTFTTHVVVPVPYGNNVGNLDRGPTDEGQIGIAGVAFDPSGNWLYSGTQQTIVEWDLRRIGGGEGGTWTMA